jgi:hypothetical protein
MLVVQEKRESGLIRLSSFCICLALMFLIIASVLPMFVVTSLQGEAKVLIANLNVDLMIGDGLWKRNVCFGDSQPSEDTLKAFGLTCRGQLQTYHCENHEADLTEKEQQHCDDFYLLQGMESLAIFSTFITAFIVSLARSCATVPIMRTAFRLSSIVGILISISAASAVIRVGFISS